MNRSGLSGSKGPGTSSLPWVWLRSALSKTGGVRSGAGLAVCLLALVVVGLLAAAWLAQGVAQCLGSQNHRGGVSLATSQSAMPVTGTWVLSRSGLISPRTVPTSSAPSTCFSSGSCELSNGLLVWQDRTLAASPSSGSRSSKLGGLLTFTSSIPVAYRGRTPQENGQRSAESMVFALRILKNLPRHQPGSRRCEAETARQGLMLENTPENRSKNRYLRATIGLADGGGSAGCESVVAVTL